MQGTARNASKIVVAVAAASLAVLGTMAAAAQPAGRQHRPPARFTVTRIIAGASLSHSFRPAGSSVTKTEPLANPDDLTALGGHLFGAFQNGVGPQGEASSSGNLDSTIVEFSPRGKVLGQWDVRGKCDGLTADPRLRVVIATVNEDAHSSLYTISPGAAVSPRGQVRHYRYNRPLPSKGGTDAISVYHGLVLISASAPGTTGAPAPQPGYPALYRVTFSSAARSSGARIARIHPTFSDEAPAVVANVKNAGKHFRLALTDPDSNSVVPAGARRFAGTFMLTSQGDKEQIYVVASAAAGSRLPVLSLSQAVDDTAWPTSRHGRLYASDATANAIDVITGQFPVGVPFVAVTPCDASGAPSTCPAPPAFPANYLGILNPFTGKVSAAPVTGVSLQPKGLLFLR